MKNIKRICQNRSYFVLFFFIFSFIMGVHLISHAEVRVTGSLEQVWSRSVGDFPWFQQDNSTRAFAINPATGNVLVGSYHREGGIFVLSHEDGSVIRKLSGSDGIISNLGVTSVTATRSGKIFASNLTYEMNTTSNIYYWPSEEAGNYHRLTTTFSQRAGDWMDSYEDDEGNIIILVSGPQYTRNPALNFIYYEASRDGWMNSTLRLRGAPESADNLRMVTIAPQQNGDYEIWMKDIEGQVLRFDSRGEYIGTSVNPGNLTILSNYYQVGQRGYIASSVFSRGGQVNLYDAESQSILETVTINNQRANENGTGRVGLAGIDGKLHVMVGVTNNSISLYRSGISVPDISVPSRVARPAPERTPEAPDEVTWHTDLNRALRAARNTNQSVLLYFYTPQAEACQDYNRYFDSAQFEGKLKDYVLVRINLAENVEYSSRFSLYRVPAIVVLDSQERELFRITSPLSRDDLYERL